MFFAYDPGDDFETLEHAARRLHKAGFSKASHNLRAYVLIGYPKDTFELAEARLRQMLSIGFTPMAMLWRPETPSQEKWAPDDHWRAFQRRWARPAIIHARQTPPPPKRVVWVRKVLDADRANRRPAHRHIHRDVYNGNANIHVRPSGTSAAAALRRLERHRPDILERVLAARPRHTRAWSKRGGPSASAAHNAPAAFLRAWRGHPASAAARRAVRPYKFASFTDPGARLAHVRC
jgi:hypothetical protein